MTSLTFSVLSSSAAVVSPLLIASTLLRLVTSDQICPVVVNQLRQALNYLKKLGFYQKILEGC